MHRDSGSKSERKRRRLMRGQWFKFIAMAGAAIALAATPAHGDIVVGVVTSQTGPVSSIGIPYGRGVAAGHAYISEVGGEKIRFILLDDGSDPSAATKNARKLIEEEK